MKRNWPIVVRHQIFFTGILFILISKNIDQEGWWKQFCHKSHCHFSDLWLNFTVFATILTSNTYYILLWSAFTTCNKLKLSLNQDKAIENLIGMSLSDVIGEEARWDIYTTIAASLGVTGGWPEDVLLLLLMMTTMSLIGFIGDNFSGNSSSWGRSGQIKDDDLDNLQNMDQRFWAVSCWWKLMAQ